MPQWHAVMPFADLPQGMTDVEVADELILLVRDGDSLHACAGTCPHKFTLLSGGQLANGQLTCPMHAATFDLSSGRPLPGMEWAGNLPLFPVRVNEGVVEVQV
jgi:apoptosis-inducing factor 3